MTKLQNIPPLSTDSGPSATPPPSPPLKEDNVPLIGIFAVGFGLLGIFTLAIPFVPLALVLGILALLLGQIALGLVALLLGVAGAMTSPVIMTLVGIGAFLNWLGF